jgi:radical SAM superfamily enzyme YgiQ (UPF0313 family)
VMPERVMAWCGTDIGIRGDGEFVLPELASRLEAGLGWKGLPGLVLKTPGGWHRNPVAPGEPLAGLPPMSRGWVDNRRYFREGGQAGIETKRGCSRGCVYCADPLAKGRAVRLRPPEAVADELARLLGLGIDHVHTCDSEFNVPPSHAAAVCREIVRRGLGDRLRWYAYCSPAPFDRELALLMRRAGCAGINFGVDSGDEAILAALGRDFGPADILSAAAFCREAGMAVMFDLLFGSPGETRESVERTVELMRRAAPDRAGVAVGVRIYPGTPLSGRIGREERLAGGLTGNDPAEPVFFLEPAAAPFIFEWIDDLVGGDERFLFFDPSRPEKNYNYNANRLLEEAIREGARGAYWDILRRLA